MLSKRQTKHPTLLKKFAICFLILFMLFTLASCFLEYLFPSMEDKVLKSLGKYDSKKYWSSDGYQDFTKFGIYSYRTLDLEKNQYFTPLSEADIETLCTYIDDFERWIEAHRQATPNHKLVLNYAFDRSIIDTDDYFYIYNDDDYSEFGFYDVWFFDSQTNLVYFFHNNI